MERKLPPDRVMKLYEQFMEMKRRVVLSKNDLADLDEIYDTIGIDTKNRNLRTLKDKVRKLTEHLKRAQVPCSKCGKPIDLADESSIHFLRNGISFYHPTGCPQ
jgi:plasmid stabilization system protein ParE